MTWFGQEEVTWENKQKVQFFLACLLAFLASWPCFRLMIDMAVGLTIGLAIGGAESTGRKIAVGFLGWSLWKKLISFLRCFPAEIGSKVFSSLG